MEHLDCWNGSTTRPAMSRLKSASNSCFIQDSRETTPVLSSQPLERTYLDLMRQTPFLSTRQQQSQSIRYEQYWIRHVILFTYFFINVKHTDWSTSLDPHTIYSLCFGIKSWFLIGRHNYNWCSKSSNFAFREWSPVTW